MTRIKCAIGIILLSVVASGVYIWQADTASPPEKQQISRAAAPKAPTSQPLRSLYPSEPKRLQITSLNIDARIAPTGQTKSGEMESPKDRLVTGWYKYGYLPGSLGNAVVAGHSWHTTGRGIFASLDTITHGDTIRLSTDASVQEYVVTETRTFDANHPFTEDIFGPSTKARLNLVTCTGAWNAKIKRYENRFVVFSEFVKEQPISNSRP